MPIRYTGARVKRIEDPRLLRGVGRFLDDIAPARGLAVAFVRSPHAHAAIVAIDATRARRQPGVVAVLTADDVRELVRPLAPSLEGAGFVPSTWPILADGRVCYCGQPVAMVVAENNCAAADAREGVDVEYRPLDAVASLSAATQADTLFRREGFHGDVEGGFARAAVVVRETFHHARCAPSPMEPRGLLAEWDGESLTVYASTQSPAMVRTALASALGLSATAVRVVVPDVGGGFGLKMAVFPDEVAVAAAARLLRRPVKWMEERRENLTAASQAREQETAVEMAADASGRLLAVRASVRSDAGAYHAYPLTQALEPLGTAMILPGPYVLPAYAWEAIAVRTHKAPLGAYRGVGMTMAAFVMERMLDQLANRLDLDPAEIRRRNLIPRDAYPFTSATDQAYDSGDYPKALEQLLAQADYARLRREQEEAREQGRWIGIGLACYTEYTGMGSAVFRRRGMRDVSGVEAGRVTVQPDGTVCCAVSFPSQGQGHATTVAQIVADRLGVRLEQVRLLPIDTQGVSGGSGTFGSRGAIALGGTVGVAADLLRIKIVRLAAHFLEAAVDDIALADGRARVRGAPGSELSVAEIARRAYAPAPATWPQGLEPGLESTVYFDPPGPTYSGAVHLSVVEVDPDTGRVRVLRYALVEDCGPLVNPLAVDGQIHGAVTQGIGEALLEALIHDETGQLLTATLMDYALPRACDVPSFEIGHLETPSPLTPGGIKGMGEGGTIGAPAAIANAVADAVRQAGVSITALPIRAAGLIRLPIRAGDPVPPSS
jgi:aerobic carbon-monoxide dehydrogenase large subunit